MILEAYEESSSPRGYFDNHQLIQLAAQLLSWSLEEAALCRHR